MLALKELSVLLTQLYTPTKVCHGFVSGRSIVTNAGVHGSPRWVVRVDILDFFPTITFARILGLLKAKPYELQHPVATAIAELCTQDQKLFQGNPCAPVLANMTCRGLDIHLFRLARSTKSKVTRYADDIVFSGWQPSPPPKVAAIDEQGLPRVGDALKGLVEGAGFAVNSAKTRVMLRHNRQCITGVVVNKKRNVVRTRIREVRAMCHAWEAFGYQKAESEHIARYRNGSGAPGIFRRAIEGKIEYIRMIKGSHDPVVLNLVAKYRRVQSGAFPKIGSAAAATFDEVVIFCEGKTDIAHLQRALGHFGGKGLYSSLSGCKLRIVGDDGGSGQLLQTLKAIVASHPGGVGGSAKIFLFDRDEPAVLNAIDGGRPKRWVQGVGSLAIPVPKFRDASERLCVELLYPDEVLALTDDAGRRLYRPAEFVLPAGRHKQNSGIRLQNSARWQSKAIIDSEVYDINDNNVALGKAGFSALVGSRKLADSELVGLKALLDELQALVDKIA